MIEDNIIYWGFFIDDKSLRGLKSRLGVKIPSPAVTFSYRPAFVPEEIFGTKTEAELMGHAYDGYRDAYEIRFADDVYDRYYDGDKRKFFVYTVKSQMITQHNARNMLYMPLEEKDRRKIKGRFGYMSKDGCIYFQSPEKTMWLKMLKELKGCLNIGSFRAILEKYKAESIKDIATLNALITDQGTEGIQPTPENRKIKKFLKEYSR